MKNRPILTLAAILSLSGIDIANATPDCAYIQRATKSNANTAIEFTTLQAARVRKNWLLRDAVVQAGMMTGEEARATPLGDLIGRFDPIYKTRVIGSDVYQTVDIALGDNPYVYWYRFDGGYTNIASNDGTLMVRGVYCPN